MLSSDLNSVFNIVVLFFFFFYFFCSILLFIVNLAVYCTLLVAMSVHRRFSKIEIYIRTKNLFYQFIYIYIYIYIYIIILGTSGAFTNYWYQ